MQNEHISKKILNIQGSLANVMTHLTDPEITMRGIDPEDCDFLLGNPHDMPLPGFVDALKKWATPQNKDWFAYKMSEPHSQEVLAESLQRWRGIQYKPENILLTNGAFAAIGATLNTLVDPGDEVIFLSPPWFFYETLILSAGGVPVRVKIDPQTFEPDLEAISTAITARTRAIIINSPNNPTGKIYSSLVLKELANLLSASQKLTRRPIFLLSDESYSRILYDGRAYPSPTTFYPYSFLLYTYGKTLLTPGQRLGFIALSPEIPEGDRMRNAIFTSQFLLGFAFPNAILQHALEDIDKLSINIEQLERRRNRMVQALSDIGYDLHYPEGTFYLLPQSPMADDFEFTRLLRQYKIYCLPGTIVEMPGYFRISLTASDDMVERSLHGFAAAREMAMQTVRSAVS